MGSGWKLGARVAPSAMAAAFPAGAAAVGSNPILTAGASAKWTTLYKSPLAIEGLTGDHQGNICITRTICGLPRTNATRSTGRDQRAAKWRATRDADEPRVAGPCPVRYAVGRQPARQLAE